MRRTQQVENSWAEHGGFQPHAPTKFRYTFSNLKTARNVANHRFRKDYIDQMSIACPPDVLPFQTIEEAVASLSQDGLSS